MTKTLESTVVHKTALRSEQVPNPEQSLTGIVLDVGCGKNKVPGAIGMNWLALPGVDVVHDLNSFPYPLAVNSVDNIHINHVLEHLPDVMATMEEL